MRSTARRPRREEGNPPRSHVPREYLSSVLLVEGPQELLANRVPGAGPADAS